MMAHGFADLELGSAGLSDTVWVKHGRGRANGAETPRDGEKGRGGLLTVVRLGAAEEAPSQAP